MNIKFHFQLSIILTLILHTTSIYCQSNYEDKNSFQKTIKFNSPIDIEKAKEKFISEFQLDDKSTFINYQSHTDRMGVVHKKYQQYYNGIKVEYGTMILHYKEGNVMSINGELYNPKGLNISSQLSPKIGLNKAMAHISADNYLWDNEQASEKLNYKKPSGELVVFPVINNNKIELKLAYKYDIYATAPVSRGLIYIDAINGDFLFNDAIIKHYKSISSAGVSNTYSLNLDTKTNNGFMTFTPGTADTRYSGNRIIETRSETNGTFTLNDDVRDIHTYNAENAATNSDSYLFTTVDFVDNDNVWTSAEHNNAAKDNAALDAHWGAMNVYDFWQMLGRDSYDNAGSEIRSYVHLGTNYFNAFWDGSVMSYGDGSPNPLTSIDVVGHEIAHAVTTTTANLIYARESGGMNEGFSDIFGAAIEFFAKGTGTDMNPNAETWAIGEDFGTTFRSMSDPKSKGDPDTYNGINYIDASTSCEPTYGPGGNDGCGVHTNSGVLNHWFYILVVGKTGTNDAGDTYNVTGIGMTKAQEIAYLTLRDYLSPNSTFIDARNGAIEVAVNLYGSNSIERQATQDAFYAVNVGEAFIPYDTDLNLVEFSELVDITCGEDIIPKIKVRNSGIANPINAIQVNYSIDGEVQTPFNWNGTLNIGEETEISIPAISKSTIKSYDLVVETIVSGDQDNSNNILTSAFRVNRSDATPTEVNTFENFLFDYWLTYNEGGGSNLWVIGNPNKATLNSVTSGTNAYVTGTTSDYSNNTKAYLISPCYDLTALNNPLLKFNMAFKLQENFDLIYVEYSTDLINWKLLGSATDANWYNSDRKFESAEISSDCQNCPGAQWTGSSSVFREYSHDLSEFSSFDKINFRFVFHSNESGTDEGVIIDDFVIEEDELSMDDFYSPILSIYPNPSSDKFTLSLKDANKDIGIEIYDIAGKIIFSKENISIQNSRYDLDLSNYSKGLYFARIKIEENLVVKKLLLN